MKRIVFGIFLLLFVCLASSRASIIAIGSLTTVSNTTLASVTLQTNSAAASVGTFVISNGGLQTTNSLSAARQFSLDGTNWYQIGPTYLPTVTNAASDTLPPAVFTVPIYLRLSVTTTNSVQVGAVYLP